MKTRVFGEKCYHIYHIMPSKCSCRPLVAREGIIYMTLGKVIFSQLWPCARLRVRQWSTSCLWCNVLSSWQHAAGSHYHITESYHTLEHGDMTQQEEGSFPPEWCVCRILLSERWLCNSNTTLNYLKIYIYCCEGCHISLKGELYCIHIEYKHTQKGSYCKIWFLKWCHLRPDLWS